MRTSLFKRPRTTGVAPPGNCRLDDLKCRKTILRLTFFELAVCGAPLVGDGGNTNDRTLPNLRSHVRSFLAAPVETRWRTRVPSGSRTQISGTASSGSDFCYRVRATRSAGVNTNCSPYFFAAGRGRCIRWWRIHHTTVFEQSTQSNCGRAAGRTRGTGP